jgi:hypothetical protein
LTFVLLGVATPTDLIEDLNRTPFNVGSRILLQELSYIDAAPLRQGLDLSYAGQGDRVLERIFYWTNGHPYLTQRLCLKAVEAHAQLWDDTKVDELVTANFLSDEARRNPNLIFVREQIRAIAPTERQAMLKLYREIYSGRQVSDDERSQPQLYLKLFGLVRAEQGQLRICNRIYRRVFDEAWIDENLRGIQTGRLKRARQMNWTVITVIAIVLVALVAIVAIVFLSRLG